ncbi:hypothetical protein HYX13_03375 [Candidatus Woesearchaeota archaeon]|nr:hypothetical protein [Candidatus Woesearchaeota archaeon]
MGKIKYLTKVRDFLQKTPVAHISSLKKIVGRNSTYISLLLNSLVKRKEVYRLTKGWYAVRDDPSLAVFCFKPAYLGLQEALSIHGLWEQETNAIVLTTKTVREGKRMVFGAPVFLQRIPKELFFGVIYVSSGEYYLPVSDVEKTLIDMVYFAQPIDKELLKEFKKRVDKKKLNEYLKMVDAETLMRFKRVLKIHRFRT